MIIVKLFDWANKWRQIETHSFVRPDFTLKQGRIHGNPVADGWAGAVMRKSLAIQKCYGPMDGLKIASRAQF